MIVRVTVAVALTGALLAASTPAIERARVDHSDARIAGEVDRLAHVATSLAAENDLVPDGGPPARTQVTLRLPERSWGNSGTALFAVRAGSQTANVVWAATDGSTRRRTVPGVDVDGPPGGLELREGGRHRLVVELRETDGGRTVRVRRPGRRENAEE